MVQWKQIQRDGYQEQVIEWEGLTEEQIQLAHRILYDLYHKDVVHLIYRNGKRDVIQYTSGDIWLNKQEDPFDSSEDFEIWLEEKMPNVVNCLTF